METTTPQDFKLQLYEPKRRYVPKNVKHEESLQKQVCQYLRLQFPQAIFRSDYASGLHLKPYQARQHASMQSGRAWPDLFIYEPRAVEGVQYAGLALELKKEGTAIVLKTGKRKGQLVADPHIREQATMLKGLKERGYYAAFAVGFEHAVRVINKYLGKRSDPSLF